ncbi:peroxidase 5-like [Fagus crenata]
MAVGRGAIVTIFIFFSIFHSSEAFKNPLFVGFYDSTCPQAENIVFDVVFKAIIEDSGNAAGLIRLFFHDCFVNGCDASILLDSTPSGEPVEKNSTANGKTLRGLEVIDEIKVNLEAECPGIVSCADILSFAAREAVVHSGIFNFPYAVPAGRRDGLSSRSAEVTGNLVGPSTPMDEIIQSFTKRGLNIEEMVALLGAHSVGITHCRFVDYRLYNFRPNATKDPILSDEYAYFLSGQCPPRNSSFPKFLGGDLELGNEVRFDLISPPSVVENTFYTNLLEGKSLLESDQMLASDPRTRPFVKLMASDQFLWSRKFARAMIQLGMVDVLTGSKGEIRRNCRAVN